MAVMELKPNESVFYDDEDYKLVKAEDKLINKIKRKSYFVIKRLFDIICGIVGCIFLIPVILILKIIYLLNKDTDPLIFSQVRIGKNGKEFKLYKFRSMVSNADAILFQLISENPEIAEEYKINKKLKNDPRVTPIGSFIRKASIDELPQLFNVLKGDMSLIGNRPYLPREKDDMGKYYDDIVKTRPALTGIWQTSGRNNTTFEDRLKLESYYSNYCNLKIDIKIFLKTFAVVLLKKGAK
jgi:undecaprenyl-phosphate galactose phosphotransferase